MRTFLSLVIGLALASSAAFAEPYWGNFPEDATLTFWTNTIGTTGAPITIGGTGDVVALEEGTLISGVDGITFTEDVDTGAGAVTGLHKIVIDTSDTDYEAGKFYTLVYPASLTADSISIAGRTVGSFYLGPKQANTTQVEGADASDRFYVASGTADSGNTLTLVDAARTEADNYWNGSYLRITSGTTAGQIRRIATFTAGSDTITVDRAFTDVIGTNTYEILATAGSDVNVTALAASATPVTNMGVVFNTDFATNYDTTRDMFNVDVENVNDLAATGPFNPATDGVLLAAAQTNSVTFADLNVTANVGLADGLTITRSTGNSTALTVTGNGTGNGATITSGSGASGSALRLTAASTNGSGLISEGTGSGYGGSFVAGDTGTGLRAIGGATSGSGAVFEADALGHGFVITGSGADQDGIVATGGSGSGVDIRGDITGNVTGNLSGTVTLAAAQGDVAFEEVVINDGLTITGETGQNDTALTITGAGTGNGATITSGSGATGDGLKLISAATLGNGVDVRGAGADAGLGGGAAMYLLGGNSASPATVEAGPGLFCNSGTSNIGSAISISSGATVTGHGVSIAGLGAGNGIQSTGGPTGNALKLVGGGTSGSGVDISTTSGAGIQITTATSGDGIDITTTTSGHGIDITTAGSNKHGIYVKGGDAGTSDGIKATAGTGGVDIRGGITGNITGNVGGTINGLTAVALKDFFDTDSGTTYAAGDTHANSVVKQIADNAAGGGGGGGLTAQQTRDAMKLAPTVGAADPGSIDAQLATIDTVADGIQTTLDNASTLDELYTGSTLETDIAEVEGQTDDIGAAGAGLTLVPWNASWDAEVAAELTDIGLDHLLGASVVGTDITDNSIIAKLASKSATADWDTFNNTTDSLEANRDNIGTVGAGLSAVSGSSRLLSTTIATLDSQTSFTLTAGSTDDHTYKKEKGVFFIITNASNPNQKSVVTASAYSGATRRVTLTAAPTFTIAPLDTIEVMAAGYTPAPRNITVEVSD